MMGASTRSELARRWEGRTLSERYRLERLVGLGGMGAVYAARHLGLDRVVAVKTVLPGLVLSGQGERLLREARAAAKVAGRGVVDVLDVAVDDVVGPYLVMELLKGETLADHLEAHAPLGPAETVALLGPVLRTLESLHAEGLVHRDLKPHNVFLAEEDGKRVAKLLDFGLVRPTVAGSDGSITASGAVVGTPRYMAPEQARGASLEVGPAADQYAAGAMLYYALGGRKPFDGFADSEEVLELARAGGPPPLSQVAAHVPGAVAKVVERAMASEPQARWPSVGAMREALLDACGSAALSVPRDASITTSTLVPAAGRESSNAGRGRPAMIAAAVGLGVAVAAVVYLGASTTAPTAPSVPYTGAAGHEDVGQEDVGQEDAGQEDAGLPHMDAGIENDALNSDVRATAPDAGPTASDQATRSPAAQRRGEAEGNEGSPPVGEPAGYRGRAGEFRVEDF